MLQSIALVVHFPPGSIMALGSGALSWWSRCSAKKRYAAASPSWFLPERQKLGFDEGSFEPDQLISECFVHVALTLHFFAGGTLNWVRLLASWSPWWTMFVSRSWKRIAAARAGELDHLRLGNTAQNGKVLGLYNDGGRANRGSLII